MTNARRRAKSPAAEPVESRRRKASKQAEFLCDECGWIGFAVRRGRLSPPCPKCGSRQTLEQFALALD